METLIAPDNLDDILTAAHARHTASDAALRVHTTRRERLIADATAAEAELDTLAARRRALLRPAHDDADPAALAELQAHPARGAALRQRAIDAREAAALDDEAIATLAPARHADARAVLEARFAIVRRNHHAEGVRLRAAVEALQPALAAWLVSAKHFDEQRHAVHGIDIRADNDGPFRLMRAWTCWSKDLFRGLVGRDRVDTLSVHFPPECGDLVD